MPRLARPLSAALAAALLAAVAGPALAHPHHATAPAAAPAPAAAAWAGGDAATRPQDDLFRHANGGWLDRTPIPADKRAFGTFLMLRERSDAEVRALLDEAVRAPGADADAKLIGAYYGALLDVDAIEKKGLTALQGELAAIDAVKDQADLATALGRLLTVGVAGPVAAWVQPDDKDPRINAVYWGQAGLGLPDREDYLDPAPAAEARRKAYRTYVRTLLALGGAADPDVEAEAVFGFETEVAKIAWKRADRRDPVKTYNPIERAKLGTTLPGFDWERYADAVGMPKAQGAVVQELSFVQAFPALAARTPLATWRSYMRARLLSAYASDLPKAFREAEFQFSGAALKGLAAPQKRWQTAVQETNDMVGEAIGKRFVARHFPPAAKARMRALVTNLMGAYRERLAKLDWMTPATRKQAIAKLEKITVKIGYPDVWRGHQGLVVAKDDALGNALRAVQFHHRRDMAEAGEPVDRTRWMMHPQVVNAYYNPLGNEIVFPAAILRPPFFDMAGDDAFNYGAIGAVIGHEISHGFDDQGRQYDADGRLRDWWSKADATAFESRANKLVAQYAGYEPIPGLKVDGKLTLGENIADLAGVTMALRAYHRSLGGRPAPVVGGLTGDQRFFLGYARNWRSKSRPEWLRTRLISDSHSPEQYRTNGVVTNLDAFHEAFRLRPGDGLYKAPADRVRIW
jgi:predicted metalloendopeptidase